MGQGAPTRPSTFITVLGSGEYDSGHNGGSSDSNHCEEFRACSLVRNCGPFLSFERHALGSYLVR